jgi:hypothetical protein
VRGIIGDTKIGAIEIIGPGDDEDSFVSYLHDCFGHVTTSSLNDLDGDRLRQGARRDALARSTTRATCTLITSVARRTAPGCRRWRSSSAVSPTAG